jgi:hypothetical protein
MTDAGSTPVVTGRSASGLRLVGGSAPTGGGVTTGGSPPTGGGSEARGVTYFTLAGEQRACQLHPSEHEDFRIFGTDRRFPVYLTNVVVVDALPRCRN